MKKLWVGMVVLLSTISTVVYAKPINEYTVYRDTVDSKANESLLSLRALGVIPTISGTKTFAPKDIVSKEDLGYWAAHFLTQGDEDKDAATYVQHALDLDIITSREGNATYEDVMVAYFGKDYKKEVDLKKAIEGNEKKPITREKMATLLGLFLHRKQADGLFEKAGYQKGPAGTIERIDVHKDKKGKKSYRAMIDGNSYQLDQHLSLLNGPTDVTLWTGKKVTETWIQSNEKGSSIKWIKAKSDAFKKSEYKPSQQAKAEEKQSSASLWIWIGSVFILLIAGFAIWKRLKTEK